MSKPTQTGDWDSSAANIVQPSSGEIAAGWAVGQVPPSGWFNWWMNKVDLWIDWLNAYESTAHTWTATQSFTQPAVNTPAFIEVAAASNGYSLAWQSLANGVAHTYCRRYIATALNSTDIVYTVNASWNDSTQLWSADASDANAIQITFDPAVGIEVKTKTDPSTTWADSAWDNSCNLGAGNGAALLHLKPQTTPGSPSAGDIWISSTNGSLCAQVSGGTVEVGVPLGPTAPTSLGSGWTNGTPAVKAYVDPGFFLHLSGQASYGTAGTSTAIQLPAGYSPPANRLLSVLDVNTGATTKCEISSSGAVTVIIPNNGDTISFDGVCVAMF
jgi:hypothetical protein